MHEQPSEDKGERMRKKAFYTIAIVAIIAILLYSLTSNLDIISSPVTEKNVGDISVSAKFDSVPNLKFQKTILQEIKFTTTKDASSINVQNSALDVSGLESVEIIIQNYKGALSTQDGRISFKGTADNIYVNNVGMKTQEKQLTISADSAEYKNIEIPDLNIETIDYTTTGSLHVGAKQVPLTLQDERVIIKSYAGRVKIGEKFEIEGTADSITTPDFKVAK